MGTEIYKNLHKYNYNNEAGQSSSISMLGELMQFFQWSAALSTYDTYILIKCIMDDYHFVVKSIARINQAQHIYVLQKIYL